MATLGDYIRDCGIPGGKQDEEMEDKVPNCSICLEPVVQGASRSTAQLACSHHFHLDCIGSAFNAKGAMECPNCRRVEEGNWLMLGGSQSTDDAIYDVPYDFDDDEYLGLPVDALDNEMREYMEAGRDVSYTTHPYHPPGVICEFCEQHYCDDNPCPHIIQCPYFFSNISQAGNTENPYSSSVSSMEAEAYAEAVAELYHEYRGPSPFSGPPSTTPRQAPPEMHASSSSTDSNYVYYFSAAPGTWQGAASWGETAPPPTGWGSGWTQERRQETAHTTTFVQSSTMITTYGPQTTPAPTSFPPPPTLPPRTPHVFAPPPHPAPPPSSRHHSHSHSFPEAPPPRVPTNPYSSLRFAPESTSARTREDFHTNSPAAPTGRPTYAGVVGRRQQLPAPPRRGGVNTPQERPGAQPWRPVSDIRTTSAGGASGRHSSLPPYHPPLSSSQAGPNMVCPYMSGASAVRPAQGLAAPRYYPFSHGAQGDAGRLASQQGLSSSGQPEAVQNFGEFESRRATRAGQPTGGEEAQGPEGLLANLELNDGMWLQDRRNNMFLCSFCMDPALPRFQNERRFVNRDALSQHMRAVHGVHLDRFSMRS
ncbi:RING/U-box superfamily protein [Klebsormidium nitens]|uniref:RING/U-box superfamily protein n=1 Tax=Klebsormidium nitens TaxID=105231 RepID=A0A0U9HU46_KLENI|nr:RING/U-box superfamily protein [Klebsormidium nitens]|eukprot:GAQ80751.1 RING/U-box superfamily protein [Klebsormidium nitens]